MLIRVTPLTREHFSVCAHTVDSDQARVGLKAGHAKCKVLRKEPGEGQARLRLGARARVRAGAGAGASVEAWVSAINQSIYLYG
jgi:hypothetical protein